jgi:hypothetical protein
MKTIIGLLLLSLMTITAESSWADCTHYASPNGGGNGLSQNSPFSVADFIRIASSGQTLCLLDGTYQGDANMISPASVAQGKSGASGNPITVRALNDGQVLIDGQFQRYPVNLNGNSYWVFEGFNAKSSSAEVIHVYNGSNNNIFRRIVAWDAYISTNVHVIMVWGSSANNLFEDIGAFGSGRKITGGGTNTTWRRVWTRWESSIAVGPKNTMQFSYGNSGDVCENCVMNFAGQYMPSSYRTQDCNPAVKTCAGLDGQLFTGGAIQDPNTAGIKILDTMSDNKCSNVKILGSLSYLKAEDYYPASAAFWNTYVDCILIKDTVSIVAPNNRRYSNIGGFLLGSHATQNLSLSAQNITSVRANSSDNGSGAGPDYFDSHWSVSGAAQGQFLSDVPSPWTATTSGANLCYRYVNGVRTTQPLWPWPMNDRIKAATASAGPNTAPCATCSGGRPTHTATDVTAEVEAMLGAIPSQCRSGASPGPILPPMKFKEYLDIDGSLLWIEALPSISSVHHVEMIVDGVLDHIEHSLPWELYLKPPGIVYPLGKHTLKANALDENGTILQSGTHVFYIEAPAVDTVAPTVTITSPVSGTIIKRSQ